MLESNYWVCFAMLFDDELSSNCVWHISSIYPGDDFQIQVPCGKLLKLYIEDYRVKIIKSEDKQDL